MQTLLAAAQAGDADVVLELLVNGTADVNATDDFQRTALMHASQNGYANVVHKLLAAGAKVDQRDENGETALFYAVRSSYVSIVHYLLDAGADVLVTNDAGSASRTL